jgi:ParB family chromosome partitioning protein
MSKRNQKQKPARASSNAVGEQNSAPSMQTINNTTEEKSMTSTITKAIKIAELTVSRHNVRYEIEPTAERVKELADNIKAIGRLIHPVVVLVEDGVPGVVAGKTRLRALQALIADRSLPADAETVVSITDSVEQAQLISLSENVARENMHPADECISFRDLIADGKTVESIATAFGVTVRYIEGRLRIANLAPSLLNGFRTKDFPNLDQVMALCLTDDHAKQVAVWDDAKSGWEGNRRPGRLREAIVGEETIDALRDRRIKLVSVEEYEAAGGLTTRSLFGDQVYINDPELFGKLVTERLNHVAAEVKAEGWSWVEVVANRLDEMCQKLGVTRPARRDLTAEESNELAELDREAERLQEVYEDSEQGSEEEIRAERRIASIEARQQEIEDARGSYSPEQLANSGAVVGLGYEGTPKIMRGLVRREDRAVLDAASRSGSGAMGVVGGRETGDAGRPKADNLAQALQDDLHGLRILAVQNEVAKNVRAAKIMMALWAAEQIGDRFGMSNLPTDLSIGGAYSLRGRLHTLNVKAERETRDEAFAACVGDLPEMDEERFDVLASMSDAELDAIMAKAVALTIMPSAKHDGVTAKLLDFMGFDMGNHFVATVGNFTSRASKKLVVQALTEANKAPDADTLMAMKKGVLANTAAERLTGTGWVPELIRTPVRQKSQVVDECKSASGKSGGSKAAKKVVAPRGSRSGTKGEVGA